MGAVATTYREWCEAQLGLPWQWGRTDCISLCRRAVELAGGPDMAELAGGWYEDAEGAMALLKRWRSPVNALLDHGWHTVPLDELQDADIISEAPSDPGGWPHLGPVWGHNVLVASRHHPVAARAVLTVVGHPLVLRRPGA